MAHLAFIIASDGSNVVLAEEVSQRAEALGHTVDLVRLNAYDFPLYTATREKEKEGLPEMGPLIERLEKAGGWFVFAPEYNGSFPPVLNNTIAWLSREGPDFRRLFRDRTVALATHSGGGGHHVIMAMRAQFSYVGCNVVGRSLVANRNKPANPETVDALLNSLVR
jgi:chromate reductase